MKRIIKILFILVIILAIFVITFPKYTSQKNSISKKIGAIYSGGTLSTKEYLVITRYIEHYAELLKNKDYTTAYEMSTTQYMESHTIQEFESEISKFNFENMTISEVIPLTQNMSKVIINDNEKDKTILLIATDKAIIIVPDGFLENKSYEKSIKKKGIVLDVLRTENLIDKYNVELKITNNSNKDISIKDVYLEIPGSKNNHKNVDASIIKSKKEEKFWISFDTDISFPEAICFVIFNGKKDINFRVDL